MVSNRQTEPLVRTSQGPLIDPNTPIKRMQISGQVTLQRKSTWVSRHAQIKECIFSYKKDNEVKPRWLVDLRHSQVSRGTRENGEQFIQIMAPDKETVVKVSFSSAAEFQRWGQVFVESIKSDEEMRRIQVLEPLQRQQYEQRLQQDLQDIISRKSKVISERRAFKAGAKQLYLGNFRNLYREKPWAEDKKQAAMDLLKKWTKETTWYLSEVKGGVQAFTTQRGIDFSVKRLITEEYMQKIKENKVEPVSNPRNILPPYAIVAMGLGFLVATIPALKELPVETHAVLVGVVILMAISHELHHMSRNSAYKESLAKFNQGIDAPPLPKKFQMQLLTEIETTPAEFAEALSDEQIRPKWELKLKQIKKKAQDTLSLEYIGTSAPHEAHYDFEQLPSKNNVGPKQQTLASFLVHEQTTLNQGLASSKSIYLLEEIANRPGSLRVTLFCDVTSEEEARKKLKKFISLRVMLGLIDRKGAPVGNLAEIASKAREIAAGDVEVVTEEEDDSQSDDANGIESVRGEIEQTEDGGAPLIEEAQNVEGPGREESKQPQIEEEMPVAAEPIVEDLTTPTAILYIDEIDDWEDRMNRANYSDHQRQMIAQCLQKKQEWLDCVSTYQWEVTSTDKKENITISQCMSPQNIPIMKATSVYDYPLMQVFATLHDSRYRTIYDDNIHSASVLSKVAANTYMIYQKTKSMFIVSSRDLVLAHHVCRVQHPTLCPNGGVLILAFTPTPEQDDLLPVNKNAVRAFTHCAGWLLEPLSERQTRGTLLLNVDLKGGLANYIIKKALKMQGDQHKPLKTTIAKYLKENPDCPYK